MFTLNHIIVYESLVLEIFEFMQLYSNYLHWVWFHLVSLLYDISTFEDYLMLMPSVLNNYFVSASIYS